MSATIALLGQPNSGKSTVFNALTGLKQHVGNWPGKTVEKKEGSFTRDGKEYAVADLPGSYSLTANSDGRYDSQSPLRSGFLQRMHRLQFYGRRGSLQGLPAGWRI